MGVKGLSLAKIMKTGNESVEKNEKLSYVMIFLSCNNLSGNLGGFLVSSSHSFYMWDLFLFSDFFSVI